MDTEDLQVAAIRAQLDQLGKRVTALSPPAARMAMNRYSVFEPDQPLLFRDRASALQHVAEQLAASLQRSYAARRCELATFGQGCGLVFEQRFGEQHQHRQSQECWLLHTEGAVYHYYPFHR
uniref:hypothetical protein n=1 Tax=Plantactinospora sp. CA-294935 TaxID=3240012 RepID=UPI003D8F2656